MTTQEAYQDLKSIKTIKQQLDVLQYMLENTDNNTKLYKDEYKKLKDKYNLYCAVLTDRIMRVDSLTLWECRCLIERYINLCNQMECAKRLTLAYKTIRVYCCLAVGKYAKFYDKPMTPETYGK